MKEINFSQRGMRGRIYACIIIGKNNFGENGGDFERNDEGCGTSKGSQEFCDFLTAFCTIVIPLSGRSMGL